MNENLRQGIIALVVAALSFVILTCGILLGQALVTWDSRLDAMERRQAQLDKRQKKTDAVMFGNVSN